MFLMTTHFVELVDTESMKSHKNESAPYNKNIQINNN